MSDRLSVSVESAAPRVRRLGVLGLGEGRSVLMAAKRSARWNVARICDLDPALCQQRADEFDLGDCWTTRYDDLLTDRSIDVIAIYTPDALHAEHAAAALHAGMDVILTKPLIIDLSHADILLKAQDESGRRLMVGQSSRFIHPMQLQHADFRAGRHGRLVAVEAHYHADHRWFYREKKWSRGNGLNEIFQGLSHPVDLVRWYLPHIVEVFGYGVLTAPARALGQHAPDALHFVLRSTCGAVATVSGHYAQKPLPAQHQDMISCILRGEAGCSIANYQQLVYAAEFEGGDRIERDFSECAIYYWPWGGHDHHAGEFQNYIDYFAHCLDEGISPQPDLHDGIATIATLTAMNQSLELQRPVKLAEVTEHLAT
jgi:predicted dehydrogenase